MKRAWSAAVRHPRLAAASAAITVAAFAAMTFAVMAALAQTFHGITVLKGCDSPTKLGAPYSCSYQIRNSDPDRVKIVSLQDAITNSAASPAPTSPANTLSLLTLHVVSGTAACYDASNNALAAPFTGAAYCVMEPAAVLQSDPYSFYAPTYADFQAIANHKLLDTARAYFLDQCNIDPAGCNNVDPQFSDASSSSTLQQRSSQTATQVHDAEHNVVTAAPKGATVHDLATVTGDPDLTPTGDVRFDWFANTTCSGTPAATTDPNNVALVAVAGSKALAAAHATGFPQGPLAAGAYSFRATYLGDGSYTGSTGDCEPLGVVDAAVASQVHDPSHTDITGQSVAVGTVVHDKAIVSGSHGTPTGTVDFSRYANGACTGDPAVEGGVALGADGTAESSTFSPPVGSYSYKVHYNGQAGVYPAADGPCEPVTIGKVGATVATVIHDANHNAIISASIGSTVHDKATVGGSLGTPTGQVAFTLYSGTGCNGGGSDAGTATLGNGAADGSNSTTLGVGGLSYKAHYLGDGTYNDAWGDCENLAAGKLTPTVTTSVHDAGHAVITSALPGAVVHDSAAVAGSGATPTGTVAFSVYLGSQTCGGTGADAGTVALSGGVADPSDPETVPDAGLSYQAHYSGDGTYVPADGPCEPLAPAPLIDLSVVKAGAPDPVTLGRRITWTITVTNNGPSVATGVRLEDVLPSDSKTVSAKPSQGTCSVASGTFSCRLGTIAVGGKVRVTVITTPTATGDQLNKVTVVANEPESNTANNSDQATVRVVGAFKPPAPVCWAATALPKTLTVGRANTVRVRVTAAKKPVAGARVRLQGPGILKLSGKTNKQGWVSIVVRPKKPGILRVSPAAKLSCGTPRIGIVGVFTPPVTG